MIRRDYILRMFQEFAEMLSRLRALKKGEQLREAFYLTEEEFKRFTGLDSKALVKLSETELIAKLIQTEPLHAVREKLFFLITLLMEAGDIAVAEDRLEDGRECYLKGLHLLLNSLARNDAFEEPEFVPKVEQFVAALADDELPMQTSAMLMELYERAGQFAKAEDALFAILEADPENSAALDFGISFYERLQGQNDLRLIDGNLPRVELEAGLEEVKGRKIRATGRP